MCGIAGWVTFAAPDERRQRYRDEHLDAMTATMSCRGPDDEGTWLDEHAGLGHRRLAVIDIEGGRQPMSVTTPDGEVVIVYSGEAYNFVELRDELRAIGENFETASDTEVVLRAYLRWGTAMVDHLNGMYAFVIWDARINRMVLVRDRMGIKPLYYYPLDSGLLFGSEPKAILASPLAEAAVDSDGLNELCAYAKTPGRTVWSGMYELAPGTLLTIDADGTRHRTYWKLESRPHTDDQDATVAHVRELLEDIVQRQLISDVPRCVLLSGGIDSSGLTALAARNLQRTSERLRTFAVDILAGARAFVPDGLRGTPDQPYVHEVAERYQTEHTDLSLDPAALTDPELRRRVIAARDIPSGLGDVDSSLYMLFARIREHSTVALSGEAADEVFGGYKHFHDPRVQQTDAFPWIALQSGPAQDAETSPLRTDLHSDMDVLEYRRQRYSEAVAEVQRVEGESDFEFRMRTMSYLHLTRFVRLLLDRKDRMSMAVGLEVRVPFCDHRLVEYVYNVPWSMKTYDGREKSVLRGAIGELLPESVRWREKSPYPATHDPAYIGAIQRHARELLADGDHQVFDLVEPMWLKQVADRSPDALSSATRYGLERILDLATWLELHKPTIRP